MNIQEVTQLKTNFPSPSSMRLQCHRTKSSSGIESVAHCCQSAKAVIRGAVVASAANGGVAGVIDYFTTDFVWGCLQGYFYCECVKNRKNLFCEGTACVGLECLHFYRTLCPLSNPFDLVIVEIIVSDSPSSNHSTRLCLSEATRRNPTQHMSRGWILDDTYYHIMVGIVDKQRNLSICDSDGQMLHIVTESAAQIVSIRLTPWSGQGEENAAPLRSNGSIMWNDMHLALQQWVDLIDIKKEKVVVPDPMVFVLGRVYATGASDAESSESNDSPTNPIDMAFSEGGESSVADCPLVRFGSTPTVLISGTYMGTNPCPGVGIARALRSAIGSSNLRLIAVGDADFSDPVFNDSLEVDELGAAVHLTGPDKKQIQWDTAAALILAHMQAGNTGSSTDVFLIPVSFSLSLFLRLSY